MLESIDYKWLMAALSAFVSIANLIYYLSTVIKGKTRPHMYTWLIWGLVSIVALSGQMSDGAGIGSITLAAAAFNCFTIAILAHFKGVKNITRSDKICLIFCLIAIALWPLTKIPLLSVLLVTLIDLVGYIPTIRKSYMKPHEENIFAFSIFVLNFVFGIMALENYTFLTLFYMVVITIANIVMVMILAIRRKQLGYKILQ